MTPNARVLIVAAWVLAAVVVVAREALIRGPAAPEGAAEALPPLPSLERAPASFETEDTLPSALKGVTVELVEGRTGPGDRPFYVAVRSREGADHLSRQIGRSTFRLGLRTTSRDLSQYPCSSCHAGAAMIRDRPERDADAVHRNIRPVHPGETRAQCLTCHAADDPGRLALESEETVSLDHSYRLCAQCHFPQVDSWAAGSHGKRLVAWRGRRVVAGCADCHDPHRPATVTRIPYPGPVLPDPLGGELEGGEEGQGEVQGHG